MLRWLAEESVEPGPCAPRDPGVTTTWRNSRHGRSWHGVRASAWHAHGCGEHIVFDSVWTSFGFPHVSCAWLKVTWSHPSFLEMRWDQVGICLLSPKAGGSTVRRSGRDGQEVTVVSASCSAVSGHLKVKGPSTPSPAWAVASGRGVIPGSERWERTSCLLGKEFPRGLTVSQKLEQSHIWKQWNMALAHVCGGEYFITRSVLFKNTCVGGPAWINLLVRVCVFRFRKYVLLAIGKN